MLGIQADPHGPGVYAIVHLRTTHVYVGSSVNIWQRWQQHRSQLRKGNHHCQTLQAEWNTSSEPFFAFVVLERTVPDYKPRIEREQWWINYTVDAVNTSGHAGSGPKVGHKHSAETRAKQSAALMGRKKSPEHIARHAAAIRGRKNPGVSVARKGTKLSPEHRAKISRSQIGMKRREGTGVSISAALKGRTRTPEHSAAISTAKRGKSWSPTARAAFYARKSARDLSSEGVALAGSMDQNQSPSLPLNADNSVTNGEK